MKKLVINFCLVILSVSAFAQNANDTIVNIDNRAQLNNFLSRGTININFGYIDYPFKNSHLNSTYEADRIRIPRLATRVLLGYQINKTFSVHYSVMRAALWPTYYFTNDNGLPEKHGVWVNEWGLTLKSQLPVGKKARLFYEGGLGLMSRNGFITGNERARVSDENYLTFLSAAGFQYQFHKNWDAVFMTTYSPPSKVKSQPYTVFASLGFVFRMHKLSDEKVKRNSDPKYIWPKQYLQIGVASDVAGFTANNMFSVGPDHIGLPIFWKGVVQAQTGGALTYQRNVLHTKRVFSLDWGTSISYWQTQINKNPILAVSIFPVLRFWFLRSNACDPYFVYSVVGPTYITRATSGGISNDQNVTLDNRETGKHVTYQDFMGFGAFFGKKRNLNAELKIIHYSNGNVFSTNPGVDIPLTLNFGYAF